MLAGASCQERVHKDVWEVLAAGDLDALKAVTPDGFPWQSAQCPKSCCTPLQVVINGCTEQRRDQWLLIAAWLMDQGADPTATASEEANSLSFWEQDDPLETEVKVGCANRSALAAALRLREKMEKSDKGDWDDEVVFLTKLVALFSRGSRAHKSQHVPVDVCVVDRWDRLLRDEASHDVALVTADGACTAHGAVLKSASPVLRAALESSMLEGRHRRIRVADVRAPVVALFLDLVYVGGSSADVDAALAMDALELAHRWQVDDVVAMIERFLETLLSDGTFDQIASAALRMQLRRLRRACVCFASESPAMQQRLKLGTLPKHVMEMLGYAPITPDAKRRRMF